MPMYKVASDPNSASPRFEGVDAMIIQANSSTEAKALAEAHLDGDADAVWAGATVSDLAAVPVLDGWSFNVQIGAAGATANVTVTGDSNDTLDDIAAKLVTALNATAINGAEYNTSTNLLTLAAIADNIGDKAVTVTVTPPDGLFDESYVWDQTDVIGAIVDEGIAGAVLTVQLSTTWLVPGHVMGFKQ